MDDFWKKGEEAETLGNRLQVQQRFKERGYLNRMKSHAHIHQANPAGNRRKTEIY